MIKLKLNWYQKCHHMKGKVATDICGYICFMKVYFHTCTYILRLEVCVTLFPIQWIFDNLNQQMWLLDNVVVDKRDKTFAVQITQSFLSSLISEVNTTLEISLIITINVWKSHPKLSLTKSNKNMKSLMINRRAS